MSNNLSLKNLRENIDLHLNSYVWTAKIFADEMPEKENICMEV